MLPRITMHQNRMIPSIENRHEGTNDTRIWNHDERLFIPRDGKLEELDTRGREEGEVFRGVGFLYEG